MDWTRARNVARALRDEKRLRKSPPSTLLRSRDVRRKLREFSNSATDLRVEALGSEWYYDHAKWQYEQTLAAIDNVEQRSAFVITAISGLIATIVFAGVPLLSSLDPASWLAWVAGILALAACVPLALSVTFLLTAVWPRPYRLVSPLVSLAAFRLNRIHRVRSGLDKPPTDTSPGEWIDLKSRTRVACEMSEFSAEAYLIFRRRHEIISRSLRFSVVSAVPTLLFALVALSNSMLNISPKEKSMPKKPEVGIRLDDGTVSVPEVESASLSGSGTGGGFPGGPVRHIDGILLSDGSTDIPTTEPVDSGSSGTRGGDGEVITKGGGRR